MSQKPENPPAFPNDARAYSEARGMRLRDYFAAKAMQALLEGHNTVLSENVVKNISAAAYTVADAMLEARNK